MNKHRLCWIVSQLAAGAMTGGLLQAQDYPIKVIRIVTSGAGGGLDFTSRQLAQGITGPLGQPVIVDNRGGVLAAEAVAKAPADGYTLMVAGISLWVTPLLQKMSYDVVRDFAPVAMTERIAYVVAVHPSLPVKSIRELIALARSRPGELNYGSTGASGSGHLAGELFKSMAGVNLLWIPYKSQAQATAAVFSGEVQMTILNVNLVIPYAKSGRLKALAVTSVDRSEFAPELPTVAASGLPGYEAVAISGVLAPAKTPTTVVNRLNQEIVRFLKLPEVKERFFNTGVETVASSPEQFSTAVKSEIVKWGKVIKDADIRAD